MRPNLILAILIALAAGRAFSQAPADETQFQRFQRMSREAEQRGLAEPFRGITADGKVEPGLFAIKSSGVSTASVRAAVAALLKALSDEQRKKTMFPVDDPE